MYSTTFSKWPKLKEPYNVILHWNQKSNTPNKRTLYSVRFMFELQMAPIFDLISFYYTA